MGTAGVVADALALRSLLDGADGDAGLRMLRQGLAPFVIASLSHHLGGQVRRVPAAELYELVTEDILALREAGMDLPQTARSYCDEWRRAGILVRTTAPGSHEELYELSAPAEAALRYVSQIDKPRAAVSQSRLMTISSQLEALADETLLLTGMTPGSIAGRRLRDPSELVVDEHVETHEVQPVDMELVRAVMRETEIDMGELSEAVAAALAGASGRRPARRRPRGRTAPARADALGAGRLGGTDPQRPATGAGASALGLGAHTAGGCPLTRSSGAASGRCDCLPGGLMPLR